MDIILSIVLALFLLSVVLFIFFEAKESKGTAQGKEDVMLILGCRVRGDTAEDTLIMRSEKAAEYLKENENIKAIACGGIVHKDQTKSEAQAIFEILTSKGIDKDRIILEDKSTTTVENFINAKKLMAQTGEDVKVSLLSSEFHLLRARLIAKKYGLLCSTVAAPSPKSKKIKNYIREYIAFIIFFVGGK